MARTKPSLAEAAAARREADAAMEAARRQHRAALEIAAAAGQVPEILCRYGARCYRPDCLFKHPPGRVAQAPACRDGWHCTRKDCGFTHPAGVREDVELPFAARNVILGNGGCVVQEIRRRVRDARIHIETDFDAERMVAEIKAMTTSALVHAREYLEWAAFSMVRRGFNPNKDIVRNKEGQVSQCFSRYWNAIQGQKKRRLGRKLTKGENREAKRVAAAYVAPPAPRFINEGEWDRFVVASELARRPPPAPTRSRKRRQRYMSHEERRILAEMQQIEREERSRKRGRDDDYDRYESDRSRSRSRSRSRDASPVSRTEDDYDSDNSTYSGGHVCGFSPSDVEELACQGVKPWDDHARGVHNALYNLGYGGPGEDWDSPYY